MTKFVAFIKLDVTLKKPHELMSYLGEVVAVEGSLNQAESSIVIWHEIHHDDKLLESTKSRILVVGDGDAVPNDFIHIGTIQRNLWITWHVYLEREVKKLEPLTHPANVADLNYKYTIYRGRKESEEAIFEGRASEAGVLKLLDKYSEMDERACIRFGGKLKKEGVHHVNSQVVDGEVFSLYFLDLRSI